MSALNMFTGAGGGGWGSNKNYCSDAIHINHICAMEIIATVCPVLQGVKNNIDRLNKSLRVPSISKDHFCPSNSQEIPMTIPPKMFPITQHPHP